MARLKKLFILAAALALLAWPFAGGAQQVLDRGVALQSAVTATGNGASLNVADYQSVALQLIGTFAAVITPEGTLDNGTTWNALTCYPVGSSTGSNAMTSQTIYRCNTQGVPLIRARVSTYYSGTISVRAYPSKFPFSVGTLTP